MLGSDGDAVEEDPWVGEAGRQNVLQEGGENFWLEAGAKGLRPLAANFAKQLSDRLRLTMTSCRPEGNFGRPSGDRGVAVIVVGEECFHREVKW